MPWAKKGYVQMEEQLRVKGADVKATAVKAVANANGNIIIPRTQRQSL